jgi:hypothetical protein
MNYLIKVSTNQFLELQIESSKREAREFSNLVAFQIENGLDRNVVIDNVQKSIEGTNIGSGFICMFDWSGIEICHPDPKKIGNQVNPSESYVKSINEELNSEDFYDLLRNKKNVGGLREFNNERSSEIIYLYPVKNTDWIIAAHANIDKIESEIKKLKITFFLVYFLTCISIILLSIIALRYISNYYKNELELKNQQLEGEVLVLSKLNNQLIKYKNKVTQNIEIEENNVDENKDSTANLKSRLLTYRRDKLIAIKIEQIAFINTQNTITTITNIDGETYSSNSSLDEIYNSLDQTIFFRANRQYIISIKGIDEILKYGNNQLKIKTIHNEAIIISKNKAAEFKKWLNS